MTLKEQIKDLQIKLELLTTEHDVVVSTPTTDSKLSKILDDFELMYGFRPSNSSLSLITRYMKYADKLSLLREAMTK